LLVFDYFFLVYYANQGLKYQVYKSEAILQIIWINSPLLYLTLFAFYLFFIP